MSSSSKGQDVVDSWEEIDEERLASKLKLPNEIGPNVGEELAVCASEGSSRMSANSSHFTSTLEELRPRMILQRPQMQILRRPQSTVQEEKTVTESKPKTQIKSLDQRKQEYAEARLRILGSAHDEEEQLQKQVEQLKKGTPNTNGYRINPNNNNTSHIRLDRPQNSYRPPPPGNYHLPQHPPPQHTAPGPFYPQHAVGTGRNQPPPDMGGAPSHHYFQQQAPHHNTGPYHFPPHHHHHQPLHQQKQLQPYGLPPHQTHSSFHHGPGPMGAYGSIGNHNSNNNVLRLPAGPDGSHGFTMRR